MEGLAVGFRVGLGVEEGEGAAETVAVGEGAGERDGSAGSEELFPLHADKESVRIRAAEKNKTEKSFFMMTFIPILIIFSKKGRPSRKRLGL